MLSVYRRVVLLLIVLCGVGLLILIRYRGLSSLWPLLLRRRLSLSVLIIVLIILVLLLLRWELVLPRLLRSGAVVFPFGRYL